jgi:DNA-binding transcriptional regulator YiaG
MPRYSLSKKIAAGTVRKVRTANGYTQRQFAELFGVTVRTVKRWESEGAALDRSRSDRGSPYQLFQRLKARS